jgi:exodeoxyribonuclease X
MTRVYFFDTETTDRDNGEIIEAGLIEVEAEFDLAGESDRINLRSLREFAPQRFKPSKPTTLGALAVHGILPEELEGFPPSSEFRLPEGCEYIVGHSIDFDWEAAGRPNVKRIDTHAMAQWVYPDASGYSLVALIYLTQGVSRMTRELVKGAHSAAHDCLLASLLLTDILAKLPEITTWAQLYAFSEECRIPRTCPMKKYEGVLLTDLDDGFMGWCLRQDWLDPYFRKGIEREFDRRYPPAPPMAPALAAAGSDISDTDDIPF